MFPNLINCLRRVRALALALPYLAVGGDPALAAKLGGAYTVDDAEIGKMGSCEFESWASFAANRDRIFVYSPACVFNIGRPVELGFNFVDARSSGAWTPTAAFTAKTVVIPNAVGKIGIAAAGALVYDLHTASVNGFIINLPVTYEFSKTLRFNVNVGAQLDQGQLAATVGTGVGWTFVEKWSLNSEVFAVLGPGEANPRLQTGIRYNPTKDIDCDLIYGRNLMGERANWITFALVRRFGDD